MGWGQVWVSVKVTAKFGVSVSTFQALPGLLRAQRTALPRVTGEIMVSTRDKLGLWSWPSLTLALSGLSLNICKLTLTPNMANITLTLTLS